MRALHVRKLGARALPKQSGEPLNRHGEIPSTAVRLPMTARRSREPRLLASVEGRGSDAASPIGARGPRRGATPWPGTDQPRRRALHCGARVVTSSLPVALWRRWTSFPWRSCRSRAAVLAAAHIRPVFRPRRPALRPAWPRRITSVAGIGSPLGGGRQLFGVLFTGDKRPRAWRARRRRAAPFEVPPSAGCPDPSGALTT